MTTLNRNEETTKKVKRRFVPGCAAALVGLEFRVSDVTM
jgi:hypothetical protein